MLLEVICLPHARGGVSVISHSLITKHQSSPRTWGCFQDISFYGLGSGVFPTHVGVFPSLPHQTRLEKRLPHARGGVSCQEKFFARFTLSSPRTWGCFSPGADRNVIPGVFPTHVGVFLAFSQPTGQIGGLPHARGGVSDTYAELIKQKSVFPTHVGVFHARGGLVRFWHCLPHARGGAPSRGCPRKPLPHSWGFSRLPLT